MDNDQQTQIEARLRARFVDPDQVVVAPDPVAGFQIEVCSAQFDGVSLGERRTMVLELIDSSDVALLRLLTPRERDELGDVTTDDPEPRSLWPQALASGEAASITVNLPSAAVDSLDPPVVATFYSLRGGVGRSTALVHAADALERDGMSVLCIDMDLEAPGLASIFGVEDQVTDSTGVVALLTEIDFSETVPDLSPHIIRVDEDRRIDLMPAGRPSARYAHNLGLIDPTAWYLEEFNPLRELVHAVRAMDESLRPDVVLIDARTGISPISAPLLFDVADIAVVTFFPHPQAHRGTGLLTRALLAAHTEREDGAGHRLTPEPRFIVSPVPATPESYTVYEHRARAWITDWLAPAQDGAGETPFRVLDDIVQLVPYREGMATTDGVADTIDPEYAAIAGWIAGFVSTSQPEPPEGLQADSPTKADVLADLVFQGATAEEQPLDDLNEVFVGTDATKRALQPDTPLVLGRKGTGKTVLFRRLASGSDTIIVASPPAVAEVSGKSWLPTPELYSVIDKELERHGGDWKTAWMAIIGLSVLADGSSSEALPGVQLRVGTSTTYTSADMREDLRTLLQLPDSGFLVRDWLLRIDGSIGDDRQLLFDGLDSGFGTEREIRDRAVTGLLLVVNDVAYSFTHLRTKVLLRDDIWRAVSFPNKSHLRARAAQLVWTNQADYLRVAIRRAWRSEVFQDFVTVRFKQGSDFDLQTPIEYWPDSAINRVWELLVGERVAGGKTAFTSRWVWTRLADANNDHSPRYLVQLLHEALLIERTREVGSPFSRSIIRPKALVASLGQVSEHAVEALREEFSELDPVFLGLTRIGTTPFDKRELADVDVSLVEMAKEVGLLTDGIRDETRYRVPELYRKALELRRRGQA